MGVSAPYLCVLLVSIARGRGAVDMGVAYKKRDVTHGVTSLVAVIPLGLEPKTHALEGRCSNPAELRNRP